MDAITEAKRLVETAKEYRQVDAAQALAQIVIAEQLKRIGDLFEQWLAEQAWESRLGRMIAESERAEQAEEENPIDEFDEGPTAAGHGYGW